MSAQREVGESARSGALRWLDWRGELAVPYVAWGAALALLTGGVGDLHGPPGRLAAALVLTAALGYCLRRRPGLTAAPAVCLCLAAFVLLSLALLVPSVGPWLAAALYAAGLWLAAYRCEPSSYVKIVLQIGSRRPVAFFAGLPANSVTAGSRRAVSRAAQPSACRSQTLDTARSEPTLTWRAGQLHSGCRAVDLQ